MLVRGESSTTIAVMWDTVPPEHQNGIIEMYEITYRQIDVFNEKIENKFMNASKSETSTILVNLEEFVRYAISVRAYTTKGEGPWSEVRVATTLEDSKLQIASSCI